MAMAEDKRATYGRQKLFSSMDGITTDKALMEWLDGCRSTLHAAALDLGISASELEAKLRRARGLIPMPGMTTLWRARQVARPIGQASEALIVASRYVVTANNRFVAMFGPELERSGTRHRRDDFTFGDGGGR